VRKSAVAAAVLSAAAAVSAVHAQGFFDPPGKSFDLYSQDFNDGYNEGYGGRGVLFTVDEPFRAETYWWTNQVPQGTQLTWRLFEDGIVVDQRTSSALDGGLTDHRVGTDFVLTPGHQYDLNIKHEAEQGTANYFYAYDPALFGDAPFNVGVIKVSDGELGGPGGTDNFVMPRMGIDSAVPAPASVGLLGLAGLAAARRRR
jgi:hypothetical protein